MEKNQLAIVQSVENVGDQVGIINVQTRVIHSSGEWVETDCPIYLQKFDPQSAGSGVTYGRRYGLQSTLNLSAVDSDAEDAMIRPTGTKAKGKKTDHVVNKVQPINDGGLF